MIKSPIGRQELDTAVKAPEAMAFEQITPLAWRDLTDSSRSARLGISLLDNPAETMLAVTLPVALAEKKSVLGALRPSLEIDFSPVLPIIAASACPLLFEF